MIIVNPRNELYSVILTGTSPDEIFRQLQIKAETEAKKSVRLQFDEAFQDEDAFDILPQLKHRGFSGG